VGREQRRGSFNLLYNRSGGLGYIVWRRVGGGGLCRGAKRGVEFRKERINKQKGWRDLLVLVMGTEKLETQKKKKNEANINGGGFGRTGGERESAG